MSLGHICTHVECRLLSGVASTKLDFLRSNIWNIGYYIFRFFKVSRVQWKLRSAIEGGYLAASWDSHQGLLWRCLSRTAAFHLFWDCVLKHWSYYIGGGGCHTPVRPYAPVSKPGLLDEGRVPRGVSPGACPQGRTGAYRGVQGRTGAHRGVALKTPWKCLFSTVWSTLLLVLVTILRQN